MSSTEKAKLVAQLLCPKSAVSSKIVPSPFSSSVQFCHEIKSFLLYKNPQNLWRWPRFNRVPVGKNCGRTTEISRQIKGAARLKIAAAVIKGGPQPQRHVKSCKPCCLVTFRCCYWTGAYENILYERSVN